MSFPFVTPTPTPVPGPSASQISPLYAQCATEGNNCTFTGTQSVAMTSNNGSGTIFYRNPNDGYECNIGNFSYNGSDPAYGVGKLCYNAAIPPNINYDDNGVPIGFTQCASENQMCTPNGTNNQPVDILFGSQGKYVYANAPFTYCGDAVFGDPNPGQPKMCYYRTPTPNPTANPTPVPTSTVSPSPTLVPTNTVSPTPSPTLVPTNTVSPTPTPTPPPRHGLSRASKIWITIASLLLVIIIITAIIFALKKSNNKTIVTGKTLAPGNTIRR